MLAEKVRLWLQSRRVVGLVELTLCVQVGVWLRETSLTVVSAPRKQNLKKVYITEGKENTFS